MKRLNNFHCERTLVCRALIQGDRSVRSRPRTGQKLPRNKSAAFAIEHPPGGNRSRIDLLRLKSMAREWANPFLLCGQPWGIRASIGGYGLVANVGPLLPATVADRLSQGAPVTVNLTRKQQPRSTQCVRLADYPGALALVNTDYSDGTDPLPTGRDALRRYSLDVSPELHTCWGPTPEDACRPSCVHDVGRSQERNGL